MDKDSMTQAPWNPQTPVKQMSPIWSKTEQGNGLVGTDFKTYSCLDLLALANAASGPFYSGQIKIPATRNVPEMEILKKGSNEVVEKTNEAVESLISSGSNIVDVEEMIKTPEKQPKRKKHRPKVLKDGAKLKKDDVPKAPQTQTTTPKRKYVRKKEDQETSNHDAAKKKKKLCRRALDFEEEDESLKPPESASIQESKDCLTSVPSTPSRKRSYPSKRKGKQPACEVNLSGVHQYDELREYQRMHWLYSTMDGMRSDASFTAFDYNNCYSFISQPIAANGLLTMEEKGEGSFQPNVGIHTPIKRTTTGHARFKNLSSINKVNQEMIPQNYDSNGVLVDTTRVTLSKKKRKTTQRNQKTLLPKLGGPNPYEFWKYRHSIETISEDLRLLDINRENSENALVPYSSLDSQGNAIILFGGGAGAGAIVPLTPVKKRRARPKVDLDNETERVWKLLLENINSNGIDGSDEEKERWWKEERSVLEGRAHSFIARMHLVQGDRRFTPWKGSVVDSVVGVFLTQNVSDHLSSSAFMSLAAAFPAPSVPDESVDVGTSSMPPIQIAYLDSEESISNPPVHNKQSSFVTLQPDEEKDYVNSEETSSEIASSVAHEPKTQLDSDVKGSSVEVDKRDNETYLVQNQNQNQNLFPSEDSVLTCQNTERAGSSSETNSVGEHHASFVKLLQGLESQGRGVIAISVEESSNQKIQYENSSNPDSLQESPKASPGDCSSEVKDFKNGQTRSSDDSNEPCCFTSSEPTTKHKEATSIPDINESTTCLHLQQGKETVQPGPDHNSAYKELNPVDDATLNAKGKKVLKEKEERFDWDSLRREAEARHGKRERTTRTMDSVDWEAIRTADVNEVAETIKSRGMNNKLAARIQAFLDRLVTEHGSIDLEWLRDVPPDKTKEYLLSFRGLGLKSVECVRLLTLHHLAFPVDTNVGRIAVRLGWVPLQPLPESLQLHLLEMYPVLESIQKYLWPRLCKLDQKTLYELHYQMITFGKVFCTKSKPNCNACPMRAECRHFASAFASARLALPGTENGGTSDKNPSPLHLSGPLENGSGTPDINLSPLQVPEPLQREPELEVVRNLEPTNKVACVPIIEEPSSPEPECEQVSIADIEDAFFEDPEEIPTIRLDMGALTSNLKKIMELQDGNMSTALVALTAEAASIPMPKLKNISQLRTEHQVYELPDSHRLLVGLEKREPDDPCSYLFAIWTPGETADSVQPAVTRCASQETGKLCDEETCFSCNNIKETRSQIVRGTILIPCRTAMKGSFPLNGTYFQVNEVFADHDSSLRPIDVPREWLWNLRRKTVYFGTSVPSIFKGLPMETIQQCFWKGYVCVRGFDRKTRGPKPLIARLHFPASKMGKSQDKPSNPSGA